MFDHSHARPLARSTPIALLLVVALVAGCETTAMPTPAPSAATPPASAQPTPTPAFSPTPTPASAPTATPSGSTGLAPGALAVTVSGNLRVRSEPRVSDDSTKYTPLLPKGTELLVLDGPVMASGFTWYRVAPMSVTLDGADDGWVAIADHDGTPWVTLSEGAPSGIELVSANVTRAAPNAKDAKQAAAGINTFAFELYRAMLADRGLKLKGRNVVFSPTSIEIAFAMARAGARGTTASEIDRVLHAKGWESLASGMNALDAWLSSLSATWEDEGGKAHRLSLNLANAAFAQRDYHLEQAYLDAIAKAMGAGLGLVDFVSDPDAARKAINAWVARQTRNRIPNVLQPPNVTSATRLILANAIYLKADWMQQFEKELTTDRTFTTAAGKRIRVPTMTQLGGQDVPYATGAGWRATELRYRGATGAPLAMTLILPDDITAFEKKATASTLDTIVGRLDAQRRHQAVLTPDASEMACDTYAYEVRLFMPRFGIETRVEPAKALAALGMRAAFDPDKADFSGITGARDLFIASVIHQANIDVDEKGTEAAAVTIIGFDTTGGCGGPYARKTITLRLDKPFLFVLRDVRTGAVLFMGRVLDPSTRS